MGRTRPQIGPQVGLEGLGGRGHLWLSAGAQRPEVQPQAQRRLMNHPEARGAQSPAPRRSRWGRVPPAPSWEVPSPPEAPPGRGGGGPSTFLPGGGPRRWLRAEMEAALAGPGVARAVQRRTPSPVSVTPASSGSVIYVPREVPGWDLCKFHEAFVFLLPGPWPSSFRNRIRFIDLSTHYLFHQLYCGDRGPGARAPQPLGGSSGRSTPGPHLVGALPVSRGGEGGGHCPTSAPQGVREVWSSAHRPLPRGYLTFPGRRE